MCFLRQYLTTTLVVFIYSHAVYSLETDCVVDLNNRGYNGKFVHDKAMGLNPDRLDGFFEPTYILGILNIDEDDNVDGENVTKIDTIKRFCEDYPKEITSKDCHATLDKHGFTGIFNDDKKTIEPLVDDTDQEYTSKNEGETASEEEYETASEDEGKTESEDEGEKESEDEYETASEDKGEKASEDEGETASEDKGEKASEDEGDKHALVDGNEQTDVYIISYNSLLGAMAMLAYTRELRLDFDPRRLLCDGIVSNKEGKLNYERGCVVDLNNRGYNGKFVHDKAMGINPNRLDGFFELTYMLWILNMCEDDKVDGENVTKIDIVESFCDDYPRGLTSKVCHATFDKHGFTGEIDEDIKKIEPLVDENKYPDVYIKAYNSLLKVMVSLALNRKLQLDFDPRKLVCDGIVSNKEGKLNYGSVSEL